MSGLAHAVAGVVACLFTLFFAGAGQAAAARGADLTVKIIAFNDFHGQLEPPGLFPAAAGGGTNAKPGVGGAAYLAAHVARLKAGNPLHAVVGAGDFIGATPLISAAFHDEPTVEILNRLGLDFNAAGNHEFDHGLQELLRLQNGGCRMADGQIATGSCMGPGASKTPHFGGAAFSWLSANVIDGASGKPVLPPYGIKSFNGVRVAFIGATLSTTPNAVMASGIEGLRFLDEADAVNALLPELRAQGIHAVVVLLHEGGVQTGPDPDINGCAGDLGGSPLAAIVGRLDDAVDLVVSGHTHAAYICRLPNAAGRRIPVTGAGAAGRILTDVDIDIDPSAGEVRAVRARNLPVVHDAPGLRPDPVVAGLVEHFRGLVGELARKVVGTVPRDLPHTRVDAACNMPAGNLVADAQLHATSSGSGGGGDAQIAFMNGGGVRAPGFMFADGGGEGDGKVTYGEAFTVQPFGNTLVTMSLSAQDIKDVLEQQFAGCGGQSDKHTRLLAPSAGFRYVWNGAGSCNARISHVVLHTASGPEVIVDADGTVGQPARRYRVTVNSFLAQGGDGFSVFRRGTDRRTGPKDIDALVGYLGISREQAVAARRDAARPRIARADAGSACPTGRMPALRGP